MKFIFSLFLIVLFLNIGTAHAAQEIRGCEAFKRFTTPFNVTVSLPPPSFDFTKTRAQLNAGQGKAHEDWIKQNKMSTVWRAQEMQTLGQAAGGWAMLTQMKGTAKPYDSFGTSWCPYFERMELSMIYRTIISIPSDFPQGSCEFNDIMQHELRHHATNVAITNEIVAKLKQDMPTIILEIEKGMYIPRTQIDARFKYMKESLDSALNIYIQQTMQTEMARRNALIDTPQEYARATQMMQNCAARKKPLYGAFGGP